MITIKDRYIHSFDASVAPVAEVNLNEVFIVKTLDCYGGVIKTEKDLRSDFPSLKTNGATGPIYINNVKKGDTIGIEILKIDLDHQGVMVTRPGGGVLGDHIKEYGTRILPIHEDYALLADKIKIPLNKMIGVIGVAPENEPVSCLEPGNHGGNMDTKEVSEGNTLYLPVFHDGGLLALGDLHAAMGDGELNGSGVEIGGKVVLRIRKKADLKLTTPMVATDSHYMIISSAENFNDAVKEGMMVTIKHIMEKYDLEFADAYRLLSIVGDIKVSQLVNPKVTIRIAIPKLILEI